MEIRQLINSVNPIKACDQHIKNKQTKLELTQKVSISYVLSNNFKKQIN